MNQILSIDTIEFKNLTVEFWQLLLQFIIDLAQITKLELSDILEFIGLNNERDQNKARLKVIAEAYAFFSDEEKQLFKIDGKSSGLDFNKIDEYAKQHLDKVIRLENFETNFITFFNSIKKTDGIYKKAIELLLLVTEIDKDVLLNNDLIICDLLIKLGYKIEEETGKGFFLMRPVQAALKNTNFLHFIKIVKETMQNKLLKH